MEYYFIDESNQQVGPFTIEQLKNKNIRASTKVWKQGMADWVNAETIQDFNSFFISPPPTPSNIPPPIRKTETPLKAPNITQDNYSVNVQKQSNHITNHQPNQQLNIYDNNFNTNSLSKSDIRKYKTNRFYDVFSIGLGIFLHYITFGIFTLFNCGLKHSKLPLINDKDFNGGKAIGYLFIPFYNLYWFFVMWKSLTRRINFKFKLRNEQPPISMGLTNAVCIVGVIPYLNILVNYLVLMPILYSQIQSASNKLANENI